MKRVPQLKPVKTVRKRLAWELFSRRIKDSMKGFKKEWKISLEPKSNLSFVNKQCFTENEISRKTAKLV